MKLEALDHRKRVWRAMAVLSVIVSAQVAVRGAQAQTFPTPPPYPVAGWYLPNNTSHWYCFHSSVPSSVRNVYHDVMTHMANRTVFNDTYTANCGTSTDVVFMEGGDASGPRGVATCVNASGFVCQQFWVMTNRASIYSGTASAYPTWPSEATTNYYFNVRKTITHEVGHSLGLNIDGWRWNNTPDGWRDAMVSGWVPSEEAWHLIFISYSLGHRLLVDYFWLSIG